MTVSGFDGVDKRMDVIATAIRFGAKVTDLAELELCYAPPFGSAKDPVKAREKLIAGYTEREGNPFITAKDGFIDNIIEPATLRPYIASVLNMLVG